MVITFQSRATADVIMFGEPAREILKLLGKDPEAARGIVTVEQLPHAIDVLNAAIEEDRKHQAELEAERERQELEAEDDDDDDREPPPSGMAAPVSLSQRGWPLLEMMRHALRENHPITWGT